ncbi:hypothetical protein [Streptomyces sp. NPDC093261]|uniref:hypothetical protein n=1 Tax=Streptomyces sp. NPDC093261 TaxID=3366037 RepID=UPI0038293561
MGQTITVTTQDASQSSSATQAVTLVALKAVSSVKRSDGSLAKPAQTGDRFVFLEFTVKDTGSSPADPGAFSGAVSSKWASVSGQVSAPSIPTGVDGSDVGLSGQGMSSLPQLSPGQSATGVTQLEVPAGTGTLTLADRSGTALFAVPVR